MNLTPGPRRAFSLIEVILGSLILAVVFYAIITFLRQGSRMEDQMSTLLGFQSDAQRALSNFLQDLQEGITVVQPPPGHTLPHAVVRDKLNRLAFYSLVPAGRPGEYRLRRDLASPQNVDTKILLGGLTRVTFTALSDSALQIHLTLGSGDRRYSFHTQVRLRNRDVVDVQ
ncbi:MAG: hypothetical protein HY815_05450 [Candidatus Riflebacteria bacterium]|nr:hypothetical protein [Candidatus Riflebacteria bacterium]